MVRSLFAKILLALVLAVVLALLVLVLLTRANLDRGFIDFLERQESAVLANLAPALGEVYEARGGWDFLRGQPANWDRILRRTRPGMPGHAGPGDAPPFRRGPPGSRPPADLSSDGPDAAGDAQFRWLRSFDRLRLRERLFLLDAQRRYVAGAVFADAAPQSLEPVTSGGVTVGWVGFVPVREGLPPEAERFLRDQVRVLTASLLIALLLAAGLGYLLARHLSRPVRQLDATVRELSRGHYDHRAAIGGRDEIGRLGDNVNRLAENLERNRTARRRWMADIAHELRTPVSILKGEIEALADGVRPADGAAFNSLREEIDQLSTLVDDLQALALADAGALNLRQAPLQLTELLLQVGEAWRERLAERGIRLDWALAQGLELSADAQRLRQLFHNLFENCARYTEASGRVRVSATQEGETIRVCIEDSGPGVEPQQRDRLFERFYRVEESRSRASGGSGLGLAISRNIAEAHGGTIRAEPAELGGLAIVIELPGAGHGH